MSAVRTVRVGEAVLILGDCRDILPSLLGVDAVVTDPPYGIDWKPRVNHQDQPWDDSVDFDPRRFLGIGRHHLFWGAQYFANFLPHSESWLTWCKRPLALNFADDNRSYATTELAWRDWGKAKFMAIVWDGGMRAGCADNRLFCHPSQKPVELMDWCIRELPASDQTILDPFMGSGTTGVAAVQQNRRFIGIEREPEYFATAVRRIEAAYRQGDLLRDVAPRPVAVTPDLFAPSEATAP